MHKLDSSKIPLIDIYGVPRARGTMHGKLLQDRIQRAYSFYRPHFLGRSDSELQTIAQRTKSYIQQYFPEIGEELAGIAEGSELAEWQIITLNSRTELLHTTELQECTALYYRSAAVLGENWDFAEPLEELVVMLRIKTTKAAILTLCEPGMVAKIGLNSLGVGVCLNRLGCWDPMDGIPVHVLLRAILECGSYQEAKKIISSVPASTESNLLIGDTEMGGGNVEFAASRSVFINEVDDIVCHANHYLGLPECECSTAFDMDHSTTRYLTALKLANSVDKTVEGMKKVLLDRSHKNFPLCREYEPGGQLGNSGTISSIVMDLKHRDIHFTPGTPLKHDFITLRA